MTPLKMKYLLLICILLLLSLGTIGNAFYRYDQYYPAVVFLSESNASMSAVYFIASNLMWVIGYWMIRIFFGELRLSENEELWERLKYIVTETLMAFAIFRDDFCPHFAFLFAILLYMKIIHWLGEERVDHLERSPIIPKLFHARILGLLVLLTILDFSFMSVALNAINKAGPSPNIAFCFEYAILLPSVFYIVLKYILHTTEIHREAPIVDKAIILLYGQITFNFIRIVLYVSYLTVMFRLYLLPAFAFRQIFNTMRNFTSALNDVISFKKAVCYMNRSCPDASKEELDSTDSVCIVCREDMIDGAKKLPCNHIFHTGCLRSWFQRQQTCPTCRLKILDSVLNRSNDNEDSRNVRYDSQQNQRQPQTQPDSHDETSTKNSNKKYSESKRRVVAKCNVLQDFQEYVPCNTTLKLNYQTSFSNIDYHDAFLSQSTSSTANVSSQDLISVEKETRECIENHLRCLKSMSKMIDTTIVMMHQYCRASSVENIRPGNQDKENLNDNRLKSDVELSEADNIGGTKSLNEFNSLEVDVKDSRI